MKTIPTNKAAVGIKIFVKPSEIKRMTRLDAPDGRLVNDLLHRIIFAFEAQKLSRQKKS